jgi:DNA polymerase-1
MLSVLVESPEEAAEYLARIDPSMVAFDTETTGLEVRNTVDKPRIVQFSWRPWQEAVVIPVTAPYFPVIRRFFERAERVVGHNVKFDMHALANVGIDVVDLVEPERVYDTLWLARFVDERTSGKLKDLATRYLRADAGASQAALKKKMRDNGWTWENVPIRFLVQYGGNDAIITGELYDLFMPRIPWASEALLREQRLHPILYRMERVGLTVDHDLLESTTRDYEIAMEEAEATLEEIAPGLNPRSPVQVTAAFRKRGVEVPDTRAVTLMQMDDELARTLLTYRDAHKTVSTYLHPWAEMVKQTGRLHPWFNQLGTKTGRFSSSDPNLQNITRGHVLRDIFVAAPESKIVVADWNQMELRLYAHYADDENMRAAFLSGDDIYQQVGDLLGVPRQVGKMIMLGSIYGAGPKKLRIQCVEMAIRFGYHDLIPSLREYDWSEMYDRFHDQYRIKNLTRACELQARRRGMLDEPYIRTWGGRRQRPKLVLTKQVINGRRQQVAIFKDLANSLVQGGSADMMKQAMIDLDQEGWGGYMRLTVHDELVLEVPNAQVPEAERALEVAMTHNEFIPPLTVNVSVANRYGEAK